jgi:hypothetical protein
VAALVCGVIVTPELVSHWLGRAEIGDVYELPEEKLQQIFEIVNLLSYLIIRIYVLASLKTRSTICCIQVLFFTGSLFIVLPNCYYCHSVSINRLYSWQACLFFYAHLNF